MKTAMTLLALFFSTVVWAQQAVVDITLHPAGSFKLKSSEVKGFATQKGNVVEAKDVTVNLKNVQTGIGMRDTHTKKYLEVEKYPEAVLVSATGKDGKGEGIVRIHGVEKKVAGTYKIEGSNLVAEFPIKISDFNIGPIKYTVVSVDDNAKVNVVVPLKK